MPEEERAPKRRKSMPDANAEEDMQLPDAIVDVCEDGDAVVVVSGLDGVDKQIGIRVSSHALSMSSLVFKRLFAAAPSDQDDDQTKTLHLLEDNGDTLFLLFNVLHLRNDALPARLQPDLFWRFIACAAKYSCLVATSRTASQWLDHIYHNVSDVPLFEMIKATYILNDAPYFARFTSKWVLTTPLHQPISSIITAKQPSMTSQRLAIGLLARQKTCFNDLKTDLDTLIDPLAEALAEDNKHYNDCAPGEDPHPDELVGPNGPITPTYCIVDKEGATEYLASLRDSNLWPSNKWPDIMVKSLVDRIARFKIPEYDASDGCFWCLHVEDTFVTAVEAVRKAHQERLWGLCLDCFRVGGVNPEECRYEHVKPPAAISSRQVSAALRSISSASSGTASAPLTGRSTSTSFE